MDFLDTIQYDRVGTHLGWELEGVEPYMIDWFWSNMEKGFLLWHPEEHEPLTWAIPPKHGNFLGAVHIASQTWYSEGPNSKYDQFMLYLHPETHRLDYLESTIRDVFPIATLVSKFINFKEHDGIILPMSQYLTMGTLDKPMKKLHENHYKSFSFSKY